MFGEKKRQPLVQRSRPAARARSYLARASGRSSSPICGSAAYRTSRRCRWPAETPWRCHCGPRHEVPRSSSCSRAIFRRGMALESLLSWEIFSSSVMRPTRSVTRCATGRDGSVCGRRRGQPRRPRAATSATGERKQPDATRTPRSCCPTSRFRRPVDCAWAAQYLQCRAIILSASSCRPEGDPRIEVRAAPRDPPASPRLNSPCMILRRPSSPSQPL